MGRLSSVEGYNAQKGPVAAISQPSHATIIQGAAASPQVHHEVTDSFLAFVLAVTIITGTVFIIMCTVWGVVRGGRRKQQRQEGQPPLKPLEEGASFAQGETKGAWERVATPIEIAPRLSEEEEAYQAVGLFWAHWYEETGDPSAQNVLKLLMLKQRGDAFSCLYDMVVDAPIAERHCVLSALSEGKTHDTWRAFQKCSTTVVATLRIWARLKANKEAADQRRAREDARRRQKEQKRAHASTSNVVQQEHWYEVLGVPQQAALEDITIAYRCLMKKHHPDRFVHIGGEVYEEAVQMTKQITWAFQQAKHARKSGEAGLGEI